MLFVWWDYFYKRTRGEPLPLWCLDLLQVLCLPGGLPDHYACLPALISRFKEEELACISANNNPVIRHPGMGQIVLGFSSLKVGLLQGSFGKTEQLKYPISSDTNLSVILGIETHLENVKGYKKRLIKQILMKLIPILLILIQVAQSILYTSLNHIILIPYLIKAQIYIHYICRAPEFKTRKPTEVILQRPRSRISRSW